MGLFSFTSKRKDSGTDVIKKLEALGYYKYANPDKVAELKTDLVNSFNKNKIVSTVIDDKTLLPYDYRLYFCDGEALFEEGGLEDYLGYAKHAFQKRGLKFDWNNEISEEEVNHLNHRITVNGKEYVAFEGSMEKMNIWGVAQLNFYRLLNDQLEMQGSNEQVYPISGGEDGQFIFLTPELFDYISTTFYQGKDFKKWDIPYPVEKWNEVTRLR
ncbi:hypothetical protein [Confluentibacter citreus]|uniref:hypothetical protein n=1 Tax=Confluentibacter citreus TaxID=2007307 RepID=UPI000C287D54|nr:hypothetical protein [Confluentibacter citreus]